MSGMKDELNEKNKFVSPRNLLKTVFNGITSFWPFISFNHKFVQNQIDKKNNNKRSSQYDACICKYIYK